MKPARLALLLLAVASLAAAGCGGDDENGGENGGGAQAPAETTPATGGPISEVSLAEFKFEPQDVTAKRGSTITVKNTGSLGHDLKLRRDGKVIGGTEVFDPGKTRKLKVDFATGTYEMFCSVAGHEDSGMKGSFTVN